MGGKSSKKTCADYKSLDRCDLDKCTWKGTDMKCAPKARMSDEAAGLLRVVDAVYNNLWHEIQFGG